MPHVQHKHRVLLESESSEHKLLERCRAVATTDFDGADQWCNNSEVSKIPRAPPKMSQERVSSPGDTTHVSRKLALIPTYYYPTSYSDEPNYPLKPRDTGYRDLEISETYGPLFLETIRGRCQSAPDSGHYSNNIDVENHHETEASTKATTTDTSHETDASETKYSAPVANKRVTMSPDVEVHEYHPANYRNDSDSDEETTKPSVTQKFQQQAEQTFPNKREGVKPVEQADYIGSPKFRDPFPSERRYANSKRQHSIANVSKSSMNETEGRETFTLLNKTSNPNSSQRDGSNRLQSVLGRKYLPSTKSAECDCQVPIRLQADSQQEVPQPSSETGLEKATEQKLLREIESRSDETSNSPAVVIPGSGGSNDNNTENNSGRRPFWYRYPPHQGKNNEENIINPTVAQKSSLPVSFSPSSSSSLSSMERRQQKPDDNARGTAPQAIPSNDAVGKNGQQNETKRRSSKGNIPRRDDAQPDATMETRVAGQGQPKRVGRWTLAQLRQTDGIIPSQAGWNKGDSQKLMTNFGTPRNTQTRVKSENLAEIPEEILLKTHGEVRLQSGTNKFESQRGMTGFGTGRDVCREGIHVNQAPSDLAPLEEEKIRLSDGIVRLQAGTNKYDSQKGMTGFGTARRETTKMKDTKHPEYDHERPDQSEIPLQAGTNKFASQKGMTGFGTSRRETTKIRDTAHPEYDPESSIDATTIPSQMGSNKYASQKGMTGFGQPRWEVLDPSISWQNRKSQGMVRLQSGTNRFASQQGMTGFGTPRNTTYEAEAGELPYEDMKKSETVIPSQAGWNRGDSQKGMTGFGAPRDVKGKHLKRIWELEYPEEAEASLDRL